MAKKYLDYDGLLYFWQKLKTYFTGTAAPKMDGTATVGTATKFSREDHIHPSDTTKVDKVSGKGLSTNDFTTELKTKLEGIATGAEVNQNAFSNVKVGSTTVAADGKTDTLTIAGSGAIGVTGDATNDKVTIAANFYGECSTDAATATKQVYSTTTNYNLDEGCVIFVHFTTTNTAAVANLKLKVGNSDAYPIHYRGGNLPSVGSLAANRTYAFIFDGADYWHLVGDLDTNTTYSQASLGQGYGTCSTGEATAAKVVTLSSYVLAVGGIVAVRFSSAVGADATLNINGKGAKPIKMLKGGTYGNISAGVIDADNIATFIYDGTNYNLIAVSKACYDFKGTTKTTTGEFNSTPGKAGLVPAPPAGLQTKSRILVDDGMWAAPYLSAGKLNVGNVKSSSITLGADDESGNHHVLASLSMNSTDALAGNGFAGFMSGADKAKLDSLTIELGTEEVEGDIEEGGGGTSTAYVDYYLHFAWTDAGGAEHTLANVYFNEALASNMADGFMSSTDKVKLDKLKFDASNKIDSTILPSYVDDVIEAYARSGQTALSQNWLATGSASGTVITPEKGKIYVLMADSGNYSANSQFRWSGSAYVKLNDGGVSAIANTEIDTIIAS